MFSPYCIIAGCYFSRAGHSARVIGNSRLKRVNIERHDFGFSLRSFREGYSSLIWMDGGRYKIAFVRAVPDAAS